MSSIRLVLRPESATNIRFGLSPALETVELLHFLSDLTTGDEREPWIRETAHRLAALDVGELLDTLRGESYAPEFLHPMTGRRNGHEDFASQLERVRTTPLDRVEFELEHAYQGRSCEWIGPSIEDARNLLADQLARFYEHAMKPLWPRVESIARTDIRTRSERISTGGLHHTIKTLHPRLTIREDAIELTRKSPDAPDAELIVGDMGVMLVPTVFGRRKVAVGLTPKEPTQVIYGARGLGLLHENNNGGHDLTRVLGSTRVALLSAATKPATTKDLAIRFDLAPATVSHHLTAMSDVGWLTRERIGRSVLYETTDLGRMILTEHR